MIWLYRFVLWPTLILLLPLGALFNKKIRRGLQLRIQRLKPWNKKERPIWIHASSGEFEYAKALIREFKSVYPQTPIVVTYFSPSYVGAITQFPGVDFVQPLPLDLPGPVSQFLKKIKPRVLMLARTDFWPELLFQTHRRKIPIWLFAYTQRAPNLMTFWQRQFAKWRLQWIDRIFCVSEADQQALLSLGVQSSCEVIGDTRYDQVDFRLKSSQNSIESILTSHPNQTPPPLLVAGSTWLEDEAMLLPGLAPLIKSKKLGVILVPHEPDRKHISRTLGQLGNLGLTGKPLSGVNHWNYEGVLIIDRFGLLADLYKIATFAFIGGSFGPRSVHSVMEALGAGLPTLVGPNVSRNREAQEFAHVKIGNSSTAVQVVHSSQDIEASVGQWLNHDLNSMRASIKRSFSTKLGATQKLVSELSSLQEPLDE